METNGARLTLRDLPTPAKLVLTAFLMAIGLGYIAAMMQLHFKAGSRDGNPLPTIKDVVKRYSGSDWPPSDKVPNNGADAKIEVKAPVDDKKADEEPKIDFPPKDAVAALKLKSLINARCVGCHAPEGDNSDNPLRDYTEISALLKPTPDKSKMHLVLTAGPDDGWGKKSMLAAFTTKTCDKVSEWKELIADRPEVLNERETERLALVAWIKTGAKKEFYEADLFPLPRDLAKKPLTAEYVTWLDKTGKPIAPDAKDPKKVVGNPPLGGTLKVKIQTLISTRCAECHQTDKKDLPLLTYDDISKILVPTAVEGKMLKVITGPMNKWGKESMVKAFYENSEGWKKLITQRPEAQVRSERAEERHALIAWLEAGAPRDTYDNNEFEVPTARVKGAMTKEFVVGNQDPPKPVATIRQIDVDSLVQSTHAHMLTFALLWTFTGLIFAFTSYPLKLRIVLAPIVLVAQVADVLCWWLARLPDVGPYFAALILATGAIVGLGLTSQLLLSMFNMFKGKARIALLIVCLMGLAGLGTVYVKYAAPELNIEKQQNGK